MRADFASKRYIVTQRDTRDYPRCGCFPRYCASVQCSTPVRRQNTSVTLAVLRVIGPKHPVNRLKDVLNPLVHYRETHCYMRLDEIYTDFPFQ